MKKNNTKKIALWLISATIIFTIWITSVSAMFGQWNWQGRWMGEWKWMHQWKWKWQGHGKQEKWHNPSEMLEWVQKQDVNATEIDLLKKQYEEEMMANELYASFYDKYWIQTFKNISDSEARHMQAVKALLDRYDIETPKNYDHIQDLYESLKKAWDKSAFDALEVWVKIEFVDIDDIVTAIKSTDNDDIKIVFTNIGWASYNHLRGFLKAINNNWYETKLDWKKYISEEDLNIRWPIKYKLAEKLENEWVELPEQVSSENMKKKCKNHKKNEEKENKMWEYSQNKQKINAYKNVINKKYSNAILKIKNNKELKNKVIWRIDNLIEKIKNSDKLNKQNLLIILFALKELIQE